MATRNFEDVGPNLQKIVTRLQSNQNLLKLLYYTGKDPYSEDDLTLEQIKNEIFEKLIKVVPRVGPKETAQSLIAIRVVRGRSNTENNEIRDFEIDIEDGNGLKNGSIFIYSGCCSKKTEGKCCFCPLPFYDIEMPASASSEQKFQIIADTIHFDIINGVL